MESYLHRKIFEELHAAQNVVFISDERIDGDSLGASLAMVDYLKQHRKNPFVYVSGSVPEQYRSLPHIHRCTDEISIFNDGTIDLVVVFDCSDDQYVKGLVDLIPSSPRVINIDHHKTNNNYGHINQVVIEASATALVVHNFFEENHIIPSRDAATCMLAGLCFDTNVFSNSATDDKTLDTASKLVLLGARVQDVIRTMYKNKTVSALRVWGLALERLFEHKELGYVSTCLTRNDIKENGVTDDEIDGLSNFLSLVTDTDTLFVLRESIEGGVKVSMRSRSKDVSVIAKAFGGGGHAKAAGYTVPNTKLVCNKDGCWQVVSTK